MNPYNNLPYEQRAVQRNVDAFNADEIFWQSLSLSRKLRRNKFRKLSKNLHRLLDILEFERKRPLDDCVGINIIT